MSYLDWIYAQHTHWRNTTGQFSWWEEPDSTGKKPAQYIGLL